MKNPVVRATVFFELLLGFVSMILLAIVFCVVALFSSADVGVWLKKLIPGTVAGLMFQLGMGVLGAVVLSATMYVLSILPFRFMKRFNQLVDFKMAPLLMSSTRTDWILISAAAGIGEELLFRGCVLLGSAAVWQYFAPDDLKFVFGIAVSSVLFGMMHCMSRLYVVLATVVGLFLAILMFFSGGLLAPIITHALYDYGAFEYTTLRCKKKYRQ